MPDIQPYIRRPHFYETDQMGIIHHANYIRWFEEARVDFLEQLGYGYAKVTESGIDIVLTGVECDYKSMVRFGDAVSIGITLPEISHVRMRVEYTVTDANTGDLRSTGATRHCFFDRAAQRPVSLKKALPDLYELFMDYSESL